MNITIPQGFWYEEIDSTMDEAKRLIQANKINDIAFVVANSQTKGKGTHGRKWSHLQAQEFICRWFIYQGRGNPVPTWN